MESQERVQGMAPMRGGEVDDAVAGFSSGSVAGIKVEAT